MVRRWGLPLVAVFCFAFMCYHLLVTSRNPPELEPLVAPARAPYEHLVAASGLVEPCTESISVGSPLSGVVEEIAVHEGQRVTAGELLFRLDDRELQAQLAVREADFEAAQSSLARVEGRPRPEEIPPSLAKVRRAEASLEAELDLFRRREKLSAQNAVSVEELVSARQAVAMARESLSQAQSEHELLLAGSWERDKVVARSDVARAKSLVEQTKTDLARLQVRAPIDGDILKVLVRRGEYVGTPPGQTLIVIGDLRQMNVRVTIDEHDLPRFHPGRDGKGFVRGDADAAIDLHFVRVAPYVQPKLSLSRGVTEQVDTRVLEVIYALPAQCSVYVGQQLDVFIETEPSSKTARSPRQITVNE